LKYIQLNNIILRDELDTRCVIALSKKGIGYFILV